MRNKMEKFQVTLDIRANSRRWDQLLVGMFAHEGIRDAWIKLEEEFSEQTVRGLVEQISKYYEDREETVQYTTVEPGKCVEARYFPKGMSAVAMEQYGCTQGIPVAYTLEGMLEQPEVYEF